MEVLEQFNYYGFNRRSDHTAMEYRVALSDTELAYLGAHAREILEGIIGELRDSGIDEQALGPLREPLPETAREQFSLLCAGTALALQRAAGHRVSFHCCIPEKDPGRLGVVFEREASEVGISAGVHTFRLLSKVAPELKTPEGWPKSRGGFQEWLGTFLDSAREFVLPMDTQAIIDAARRLDIPVVKLDRDPYVGVKGDFRVCPNGMLQLGHACHKRILDGTFCIDRSDLASLLFDRIQVNELIKRLGLPAPPRVAHSCISASRAVRAARSLGFPVAVKSLARGRRSRVALDVQDESMLRAETDKVRGLEEGVVVERHVEGETTKILAVGFEVIESICNGESNLSGVHPSLLASIRSAARQLNALIILITVVSPDISRPLAETGAAVVDLDIAPSLDEIPGMKESKMHEAAESLVRLLFPPGTLSRIPLVAVTGSNGKTTITRMVTEMVRASGFRPGMASTVGWEINGEFSEIEDMAGGGGHRRVFESDEVDFGILETARGGITHSGFMYDRCNVAICSNVTREHVGQYGVDTWEDMVATKRSVLERAGDGVVINIDDPGCLRMLPFSAGQRLGIVSLSLEASAARERAGDASAVFAGLSTSGGQEIIVIDDDGCCTELMPVADLPATHGGLVRYNIYNALQALLAGYLMGLQPNAMRTALERFDTVFDNLPGRISIFDGLPFRVILNFMTNPEAVQVFCDFLRDFDTGGRKILLLAAFGNKSDQFICDIALSTIDSFDTWYLYDFWDLRGREPLEVPTLLKSALLDAGIPASSVHVLEDGSSAVETTLANAGEGDLVVMVPKTDRIDDMWQRITNFRV